MCNLFQSILPVFWNFRRNGDILKHLKFNFYSCCLLQFLRGIINFAPYSFVVFHVDSVLSAPTKLLIK